jgi:hypothetical protein
MNLLEMKDCRSYAGIITPRQKYATTKGLAGGSPAGVLKTRRKRDGKQLVL